MNRAQTLHLKEILQSEGQLCCVLVLEKKEVSIAPFTRWRTGAGRIGNNIVLGKSIITGT